MVKNSEVRSEKVGYYLFVDAIWFDIMYNVMAFLYKVRPTVQ